MSGKAPHSAPTAMAKAPVVLFGIDSRGKPKAARFAANHAGLAIKAADQLHLKMLVGADPKVAEILAKLPVGRVHAAGKMFVPFIRRDLYDKLLAAAADGNHHHAQTPPVGGAGDGAGSRRAGSPPHLPKGWQEIGVGDLVVAQEGREDGWYEAIVVEVTGDMFTLRWRDYPRERRVVRHRNRLGLLYPSAKPAADNGKPMKPAGIGKQEKQTAVTQPAGPQPLPNDWQAIDINHLVLAKDDGPWMAWWEAVPVEKAGDVFKLRWRDYPHASPVNRSRFDLALIRPDAA